jgi:hypothetical protein
MSNLQVSVRVVGRMPATGARVGQPVDVGAEITASITNPDAVDADVTLSVTMTDNQGKLSVWSQPVTKTISKHSHDSVWTTVSGTATYDMAAWVGVTCRVTVYDKSSGGNAHDDDHDAGHFNVT